MESKIIRQVAENKALAEEQRKGGMTVYTTQEIFGSLVPVRDFAEFYAKRKVELDIARRTFLDEFTNTEFTPDGKRGFKLALDLFMGLFENSQADVEAYIAEQEKLQKQSQK